MGSSWDDIIDSLRVDPGDPVRLAKRPTRETFGLTKEQALDELGATKVRLDLLQQRLFAESRRSVLLVLQALDAAGKDGTIRAVFSGLNPAGVRVTGFKVPGGREVLHDYLWRVHQACPERGEIGVFNRSHYEDILAVRVRRLAPPEVWKRRYQHIRHFEEMLSDEGTSIVKCYLHVSKREQAERLQERLENPEKRWKFRIGDLDDRALWPKYVQAYQDVLNETTAKHAPWFVVPADSNSRRNLAVARILLQTLERLDPRIPPPEPGLDRVKVV
jgi:PPK2 family polyphosphate:nucleotide phosphotransferase